MRPQLVLYSQEDKLLVQYMSATNRGIVHPVHSFLDECTSAAACFTTVRCTLGQDDQTIP